ncbi:ligand-binding sensor domain-containing protein [Paenibacillus phyllosphaerae]|uniref:Ligand-binding sensor domain-containing protein n=1 Tax=Paenibacillus phyllosphaerae TaxID=274593 RepID=A0A7W5B3N7_9BACL|nr:hypothetical protein [Paenibacillus phyllosphaerae]MBB3113642.1 ligand-binding sensor domain-containing protein [Paenibacillus phyllosphaerae]
MLPDSYRSWQSRPVHFSSVKVQADRSLFAASPGKGIFHKEEHGEWNAISEGLPKEATVNRLQVIDGKLFACTSKGLFRLHKQRWQDTEVPHGCYQYKEEWGYSFAATQQGLVYRTGDVWKISAYESNTVYDFLFTPQYLYIGLDHGVGMYDRMTDRWANFNLGVGVTSLAADREHLVGASERGELIVSNGKGGFETIRFGDMFIFSVVTRLPHVYACTDKGLFRLGRLGDRLTLFSLKPGVPVTDVDWHGTELYMATLSKGIQTMKA